MGGAPTKSKGKSGSSQHLFAFQTQFQYIERVEQSIETITTPLMQFSQPTANNTSAHLPRDMLLILFKLQGKINFLGRVARVCQLWYSVSTEEDSLWRPFLPHGFLENAGKDYDVDSLVNRNAKREVFDYSFSCSSVVIPQQFRDRIQRVKGYTLPGHSTTTKPHETHVFLVALLGAHAVGKSAFCSRFTSGKFQDDFPGYSQNYVAGRKLHAHSIKYDLWDMMDASHFPRGVSVETNLTEFTAASRVDDARFVLVLYSIADRASFLEATKILEKLRRPGAPLQVVDGKTVLVQTSFLEHSKLAEKQFCLVACKVDLAPEDRRVTFREGMALAKKLGVGFIETSAKNATNVDKLFETMCELYFLSKTNK